MVSLLCCPALILISGVLLLGLNFKYPGIIKTMWHAGVKRGMESNQRVHDAKASGMDGLSFILYRIRNVLSDLKALLGFGGG